jgi:hypothetical protein
MRSTSSSVGLTLACLALLAACGTTPADPDAGGGGMDSGMRDGASPGCETVGPENTLAACMDGCDNEPDGFADCDDFGCCDLRSDCPATSECGMASGDAGMTMPCTTLGPEDNAAACMDGCDNDDNGFADCNEFDCCSVRTDCPASTACGDRPDGGVPTNFTIEQLQDRDDPAHPAPGARVTIDQAGMIALTPRVLVGSASGGASRTCRFAIWVGAAVSGDFTAVQVQESMSLPDGTDSCFDLPVGKISEDFAPGDAVTEITNATYNEFCASASGTMPSPCTDFEQSNIFLGGTATIVRGAPGTAPTGTVVPVSDLVAAAGAPGPRAIALEGGLLTVEDVQISATPSGGFTAYAAFAPGAPTIELSIVVSNFPLTSCVRGEFDRLGAGTETTTITGVLLPNFGRWSLRVRDEADVAGLTCAAP